MRTPPSPLRGEGLGEGLGDECYLDSCKFLEQIGYDMKVLVGLQSRRDWQQTHYLFSNRFFSKELAATHVAFGSVTFREAIGV